MQRPGRSTLVHPCVKHVNRCQGVHDLEVMREILEQVGLSPVFLGGEEWGGSEGLVYFDQEVQHSFLGRGSSFLCDMFLQGDMCMCLQCLHI